MSLAPFSLDANDIRNSDTGFTMPHDVKEVPNIIGCIVEAIQDVSGDIFVRFGDFGGHDERSGVHKAGIMALIL